MTSIDEPESGMSRVTVEPGSVLVLEIGSAAEFKRRCPEQFEALVECSAFVNYRRRDRSGEAVLALSCGA